MNILQRIYNKVKKKTYFSLGTKGIIKYYSNKGMSIGQNCQLLKNTTIPEPYLITLGNNVKITENVRFLTHDGGMYVLRNLGLLPNGDKFGEIIIGDNVFIGNNVILLPGVKIGNNCVVGAGSVVTKNLPSNSVCVGVPAKKIKTINDYFLSSKDKVINTKGMQRNKKEQLIKKHFDIKV